MTEGNQAMRLNAYHLLLGSQLFASKQLLHTSFARLVQEHNRCITLRSIRLCA